MPVTPNPQAILARLTPHDALAVLHLLARNDPSLAARLAAVAVAYLSQVDAEQVAQDVYDGLDALNVEELWDRCGPNRYGYTEPQEAACEMIERVVEPVSQEMVKYAQMGLDVQAKQICLGLLMGLYRFAHESTNEFKDWAGEDPPEFAREVLTQWQSGSPSAADQTEVRQFIEDRLKGWIGWR